VCAQLCVFKEAGVHRYVVHTLCVHVSTRVCMNACMCVHMYVNECMSACVMHVCKCLHACKSGQEVDL
jgi:hypothetical protein